MLTRKSITQTIALLAVAASVVLLQGYPRPALAHDFGGTTSPGGSSPPPPPPPCSAEKPCQCPASAKSGNPINYWNGSESLAVTDLIVGGEFPIEVQRRYDSQSSFDSPLGFGWAFTHERFLYEYPDNSVIVRMSCGVRERFVVAGGAYQSPIGGVLGGLTHESDGTFTLTYPDGTRDVFDSLGRLTAAQDKNGARHEYTYDPAGKLPLTGTSPAAVNPSVPLVVAYHYHLTRIEERGADGVLTGRYVTFAYDSATGRLSSVTANDGRTVTYGHDITATLTKGNLTQVNGLDGTITAYDYTDPNDAHNLTSITPAVGRTPIVNTYDTQDRVTRQDEGTRRVDFAYPTPLAKTTITRTIKDQNGLNPYTAVDTFEFDTSGRPTRRVDALGNELRYTYDGAKALTRKEVWQKSGATVALLQAVDYTYDTSGRKTSQSVTLDSGETVSYTWTYDHDWVATEQIVSSAAPSKVFRTEYTFFRDGTGAPTNIESMKERRDDGSFRTTHYTYDARNRLVTTTFADGVMTVNEYTGDYVTKTYFSVGGSEIPQLMRRFDYDARGNRSKDWDARGNLTQMTYDDGSRLLTTTNPLGEQTIRSYVDELPTQIDAGHTTAQGEGQITKAVYDTRGRLTGMQRKNDAGTFETLETYELDSEGQRLSTTDAVGRKTKFAYDVMGRMTSETDPLNKLTQYGYDAMGNLTSITDALGRQTTFEYDDRNRRTATVQLGVTPNARTTYTYDAADNVLSVTDAEGHTTSYQYDALSRVTRVTQPLGQFMQYGYDDRDRLTQIITARDRKVTYAYETWGPMKEEKRYPTSAALSADRTITYGHDNDGNLTSVADDGVQTAPIYGITYDQLSRPYDETIAYIPGGSRVLNHRYDRFGNRSSVTLQDGTAIANSFTYNKLERLTAATLAGASVSLGYFANDDRQTVTVPGGVTRTYTYKTNFPVDTIAVSGPSGSLAQLVYAYDDVRNVDTLTEADGVHDYNYDGLYRLTSTTRPAGRGLPNESYTYDRVGNREDPTNASLYGYDNNNRISASPGLTYTFDADGNQTARSDGLTLGFDAGNRLVSYANGSSSAGYIVDPVGRRIRKTVNGVTTWYLWDGTQLMAEYSDAGLRQKRYAYLGTEEVPAQVQDANGTYYVHADRIGTPRLMTSSSGQVVWRARYTGFGAAVLEEDVDGDGTAVTLNTRLPGQYADQESGLYYNAWRDYDPATGRYVEADPDGLAGGLNPYLYVRANPATLIDPQGLADSCPAAPHYNPGFWNDGGRIQRTNNCYSYARDRPENPPPRMPRPIPSKPQPGEDSGKEIELNCSSITKASVSDGMSKPDKKGGCPKCTHKVFLVIAPGVDYHWYRQDDDGTWSHKPGWSPARNVDASGKPITNPETADRNYGGGLNYSVKCGYLCAPN